VSCKLTTIISLARVAQVCKELIYPVPQTDNDGAQLTTDVQLWLASGVCEESNKPWQIS